MLRALVPIFFLLAGPATAAAAADELRSRLEHAVSQ